MESLHSQNFPKFSFARTHKGKRTLKTSCPVVLSLDSQFSNRPIPSPQMFHKNQNENLIFCLHSFSDHIAVSFQDRVNPLPR